MNDLLRRLREETPTFPAGLHRQSPRLQVNKPPPALQLEAADTIEALAQSNRRLREGLEAERDWHERKADFAWDGAREANAQGDAAEEGRLLTAHHNHHERIDLIDAALKDNDHG